MKKLIKTLSISFKILSLFIVSRGISHATLPPDLLKSLTLYSHFNTQSALDQNAYKELQLEYYIEEILKPQSALTYFGLQKTIIPLNNLTDILQRQSIIRELVENPHLFAEVHSFCTRCYQDYEEELFIYWDKFNPFNQKILSLYSLPGLLKRFNGNEYGLQTGVMIKGCLSFASFLASLSMTELFDEGVSALLNLRLPRILPTIKRSITHPYYLHNFKELVAYHPSNKDTSLSLFAFVKQHSGADWLKYFRDGLTNASQGITRGLNAIKIPYTVTLPPSLAWVPTVAVISTFDYLYFVRFMEALENLKAFKASFTELEEHMLLMAELVQQLQKLTLLLHNNPAFKEYAPFKPLFDVGLLTLSSEKVRKAIKLLLSFKTNRITTKFKYGHMILIYKLLQESKEELIPLLNAISELQAFTHIAQMVKEHADSATPYCFTHIRESQTPFIELTDFWLPLIPSQQAVTNCVSLGSNGLRNTLFTGPHWCGKSVNMKGITYAITCSQAWGIAPARHADMSLFTGIRTAINITDNLFHGQSGFSAEKQRLDTIKKFMKTAREKDNYFILLDEPITKTMPDIIGPLIYDFGLEAAHNKHCMILLSCNHPTALELLNTPSWTSYHVELLEPEEGNFVRTFKIYPGVAHWWTSTNPLESAKRKRFIEWISQRI